MTGLHIDNLSKSFGPIKVLHDIDIRIEKGEFLVLLGESGCGKSTLLRLVSGLEEKHEGTIHIAGRDVTRLDPKDRNIAMVFQSYALYPHMTVYDNIAFGMRIRKLPRAERDERVHRAAEILKLTDYLERKPAQLSGGQRQRVAIGRAMVRDPDLFLFDEPLSNLDAKLRAEMRSELRRIHKTLEATIAYVTHDQTEAMTLADKIVLLNEGKVEQFGAPEALYLEPDTLFAARFIGSPEINTVPVTLDFSGGNLSANTACGQFPLPDRALRGVATQGQEAILAIRPEALSLGSAGPVTSRGHEVLHVEPMGSETYVVLDFSGTEIRLKVPGLARIEPQSRHTVSWDLSNAHLFHPDSGRHL
ncbi:ABC transporter ATP-binding protein [Celeribacter sp.]|uniref:ABC transporter ATP-binding protein n=1 Tax=Celeribacter sp. TaxID=1890673 RepID=UPI003A90EBC4